MPKRISGLPSQLAIGVDWDGEIYVNPPLMLVEVKGSVEHVSLLDTHIKVDRDQKPGAIRFQVSYEDLDWPFEFTLTPTPSITPIGWSEDDGPIVSWEGDEITLPEFLRLIYPTFYFFDFSSLRGADYLEAVTAGMFFELPSLKVNPTCDARCSFCYL